MKDSDHSVVIQYNSFFNDFVLSAELAHIDNNLIVDEINNLRSAVPVSQGNSNRGGWHSEYITPQVIEKHDLWAINSLMIDIRDILNKISDDRGGHKLDFANAWANINGKGNYNAAHTHPYSFLSGVYYPKVPDDDVAPITFLRSREVLDYAYNEWIDTHNPINRDFWVQATITPSPGTLLIFPSHMMHEVTPSQSESERYSVAFNTKLA